MRPAQITTRRMMVVVASCGLAAGILRHLTGAWGASELLTLALILLSVSVPCAMLRRGRQRGFWLGFSLFGWGYLALSQGWTHPSMADFLPSTRVLDAVFTRLDSAPQPRSDNYDAASLREARAERFREGGHALVGLLFASIGDLGGYILSAFGRTTHSESDPPDGGLLRGSPLPEIWDLDR